MKYYIGLLDSGNYAVSLCKMLGGSGYPAEVIPTPCKLSKNGCSYCLKFSPQLLEIVIQGGFVNRTPVREIFDVTIEKGKKLYKKIM